jgi:hypothetical protein
MNKKYYVTMTDKVMSGWGKAEGKINKLVLMCDDYHEAILVYNHAINRKNMIYINICENKPYYNSNKYYVSWHDKNDYSDWYKK